jgi:Spy/CpxP family protein refolding chaperone
MQGMMESMQGMMEHMQGMMESMQGMMGGGMMRRHGTMGRRRMGMQQHAQDDDEKEPAPHGMMKRMMQHRSMLGGGGMLGHGGMIQHHLERLGQQLELSAEQRAQMWTLLSPHAKEAIRLRADIEALGLDLRQLLDATPVDFAKVKPVLQTLASREADLRLLHLTAMQELGKVLTAEQQQKLQGIRRRMLEHRGMMGHGQK